MPTPTPLPSFSSSQNPQRATFINSTITLPRTFGFHDIDLDWEFPRTANKMKNLGLLFKEWRIAIAAEVIAIGREPLLLTVAVYFSVDYFLSKTSSLSETGAKVVHDSRFIRIVGVTGSVR
ncbi:Class V chitinase [Glycine soja]